MTDSRTRLLGSAGIDYVRSILECGKTLSQTVLELVALDEGVAITYLPAHITTQEAEQFHVGGKFPQVNIPKYFTSGGRSFRIERIQTHTDWLLDTILPLLKPPSRCAFIIENGLARPTDGWLSKSTLAVAVYKEEVYHYVQGGLATTQDEIITAVAMIGSVAPPLIGFVTAEYEGAMTNRSLRLDEHVLSQFAAHTKLIVVGAYDYEGHVVWMSDSVRQKVLSNWTTS